MQISYNWLKELVDISWAPRELAERLTLCGTQADAVPFIDASLENLVVGKIVEIEPVKGSDHLSTARVDAGGEILQVICGAPNARAEQKVVLAKVGARLKGVGEIKKAKIRGVESFGMICSERELGLSDDHSGIMVLDSNAPVGEAAARYLGIDDFVLKFDLTPNRGDSLSAVGIARDVAALAGKRLRKPEYILEEIRERADSGVKISIADSEACPRYAARIIKGVKIGPSPWWIKRKLLVSGIRPISNVVDITNLVMLELGHPLHAFDYSLFGGKEILVRRAEEGEKFITLDGKEHRLNREVLLITDGKQGVAAAGVMGGLNSEVSDSTTEILLESAYFNPVTIRRSRQKLGITTESSTRFEKGADPNIVTEALNRAAYLIQEYAGGKILQGIVDCYPRKIFPLKIKLRTARVNKILGTRITTERMREILKGLEFEPMGDESMEVLVPTFRPDVTREIDLIEEIARIEGYDKIPTWDRNIGPLFTHLAEDDILRQSIRQIMTAQGYDEIYSSGMAEPRLLETVSGAAPSVKILNPIAEDMSALQNSLIYSLLRATAHNFAHRNLDIRLFELGKAFHPAAEGASPLETEQLGVIVSGNSSLHWFSKERKYDFFDLKGAIEGLSDALALREIEFHPTDMLPFETGIAFALMIDGKEVGRAGEIAADILRKFDIKQSAFAAVLNFDAILGNRLPSAEYQPLPKFPSAPRDVALIVDETVKVADLMHGIKSTGGTLLEKVELFDLYRGKQVGEGKKSLAFALTFRSPERSLESKEVSEIYDKITDYLKNQFKAEIREG